MPAVMRLALVFPLLGLAACDGVVATGVPGAPADARGERSCVAAVVKETGDAAASLNTTLPVVEVNRYIVDTTDGTMWTCVTDDTGRALEIVKRRA